MNGKIELSDEERDHVVRTLPEVNSYFSTFFASGYVMDCVSFERSVFKSYKDL